MATVTGLTAARMLEIEGNSVVDARVEAGELILIQFDGTEINVGSVTGPQGPQGPQGIPGISSIPGEVRLWSGSTLPDEEDYGLWVWANGAVFVSADHPLAAAHISAAWRTFDGASDPGAGNFRVPDMRGLVPAGLDQMPTGARANRMTRSAAIVFAAKTGKETHVLTVAELASHGHTVNSHNHGGAVTPGGAHSHTTPTAYVTWQGIDNGSKWGTAGSAVFERSDIDGVGDHQHGIPAEAPGTNSQGSNNAHETVQPSVMVPYIVYLDGAIGGGT